MMYRHLISCGYTDAATAMTRECNIDLEKWDIADNMDFFYIVQDFEEYYEMKFMRKPVLVKKAPEGPPNKRGAGGPGLPPSQKSSNRTSAS